MSQSSSPLVLSSADRERIAEVDALAQPASIGGRDSSSDPGPAAVAALIAMLTDRSWAVRRAVVAALARLGNAAVEPLTQVLRAKRADEARLAAAVDALSASQGDPVAAMLALIDASFGERSEAAVLSDAAQVLGRRQSLLAVPALEKLTAHADDNVALAAIEALGRVGNGAGIDALIAVLHTRSFFRIFPAIDVLGRSGSPRVIGPLVGLLSDPRYALEAARALGRSGDAAAADPLTKLLRRANDSLTRVAAVSLCAIRTRSLELFGSAQALERRLSDGDDPSPVVQRLAQSVAGATPEEQAALCTVLSWLKDESAAAALIELLDTAPAAAAPALRTLGRESDAQLLSALRQGDSSLRALLLPLVTGRVRSAKDLLPCLDDDDPSVQVLTCNALGRIGDVSVVPRLFELLRGQDPVLSQAAASAIQSLGSPETERLALAAARSSDPLVRRAALRIVAYYGYPQGFDLLIETVRGADDRVREVAIHGLALMDDPRALQEILRISCDQNPRSRAAAMRALGQLPEVPKVLLRLRSGLDDQDPWVRYYACQSLGKLGDEGSLEAMLRLVRDPAGQVRVAAVEALARLDAPKAFDALRAAAASTDPDVQRAALLGIGSRRVIEALPLLLAAANSSQPATRLIALSGIAQYSALEVVNALAEAASDSDPSVRDAALGYLCTRTEPAAATALISLLGNPLARDRAIVALSSPSAVRLASVVAALEAADPERAGFLIAVLARMKRPDALAAITSALSLANVYVRRAAAATLAALPSAELRPVLERVALSDPDLEVRRACLAGLAR